MTERYNHLSDSAMEIYRWSKRPGNAAGNLPLTNPHDPTDWRNVNLVALSPRGREIARKIAAALKGGK